MSVTPRATLEGSLIGIIRYFKEGYVTSFFKGPHCIYIAYAYNFSAKTFLLQLEEGLLLFILWGAQQFNNIFV